MTCCTASSPWMAYRRFHSLISAPPFMAFHQLQTCIRTSRSCLIAWKSHCHRVLDLLAWLRWPRVLPHLMEAWACLHYVLPTRILARIVIPRRRTLPGRPKPAPNLMLRVTRGRRLEGKSRRLRFHGIRDHRTRELRQNVVHVYRWIMCSCFRFSLS